ncbi:hypothetical protein PV417_24840 [Streptomyces sp. ME19-03-3]|nr:hypothetical protein [Streptomyces sp. ME19-03-3]
MQPQPNWQPQPQHSDWQQLPQPSWGAPQPPKTGGPRKVRGWHIAVGIVGFFVLIGALGNLVDDEKTTASSKPATSTAPAASPTPTRSASPTALAASEPSSSPTTAAKTPQTAALPNLVGMGLQSAQDTAQEAGFYHLASHDSLGRSRMQILDRDWKVCFQSVKPGRRDQSTKIDLGAVKLEEDCPSRDVKTVKAGKTMPNFSGKSLAAARDALDASTSISTKDASSDDRLILMETNWKVCAQQPAAGTALRGQPVSFIAVKFGESCP